MFFTGIPLIVLHIIVDRFLEIHLNIKYPLIMRGKRLKITMLILWFVSTIFAVVVLINDLYEISDIVWTIFDFVGLALDLVIVVSAFSTYVYFYAKVKAIRKSESNTEQMLSFVRKKFKIPCLMVLTYIVFNLTSTILRTAMSLQQSAHDERHEEL